MTITKRLLDCPRCGLRHVDEGKWAKFNHPEHRCSNCGTFFPDPDGPSVGVDTLDFVEEQHRLRGCTHTLEEWCPQNGPDPWKELGL